MLSNTHRLNFCCLKIILHAKIIGHILENKQKNECIWIHVIIRLILMKMKMKMKNGSHRYDINNRDLDMDANIVNITSVLLWWCLKGLQRELSHINLIFVSFQGYSDIRESPLLKKNGGSDIWYSPATFRHNFSLQVYGASFQWSLLIFIGKNLWRRVSEANKKQVSLKTYSLKYEFLLSIKSWGTKKKLH